MRARVYRPIVDAAGNVVTTATVTVYQPGTTTLISATIYAADTGSSTVSNPFTPASGLISFYLDTPQRVRLGIVVDANPMQYIEDVDVIYSSFVPTSDKGANNGIPTLNSTGKVPPVQLNVGGVGGVAGLDSNAQVPTAQLPVGIANGIPGLDGTGKVPSAQLPSGSGGSGAALGTAPPVALGSASAGTSVNAAHEDHVHPTTGLVTTTNLTGTNPSALSSTAAPGTSVNVARIDHVHPTTGLVTSSNLSSSTPATTTSIAGVAGTSANVSRADHTHQIGSHTHNVALPIATYGKSGVLTTSTGAIRFYFDSSFTITKVRIGVGTAPTGASLIVDVKKNGTTIFTTIGNRPTISAASNTAVSGTPDITALTTGDYITVDVSQVGSTVAGSDLSVTVVGTLVTT